MGKAGLAVLAVIGTAFALPAVGQEWCYRSPAPADMVPPANDPELREFLAGEYETYIREMEAYLNCLGAEHVDASNEINEVLARWIYYFGRDAALHSDGEPQDQDRSSTAPD